MTEPASVLAMARSISHGRTGTLSTDMAAKGPDSEKGGHEPDGCPRKWQTEQISGVHSDFFYSFMGNL